MGLFDEQFDAATEELVQDIANRPDDSPLAVVNAGLDTPHEEFDTFPEVAEQVEEILADEYARWGELSLEEQAHLEATAEAFEADKANYQEVAARIDTIRSYSHNLDDLGYDVGTFDRLLARHDGDIDAAVNDLERIGAAPRDLDDALRQFVTENRLLSRGK